MIGVVSRNNSKWTTKIYHSQRKHFSPALGFTRHIHQTSTLYSSKANLPTPSYIRSIYNDSPSPTPLQILAASKFFASHNPKKSWTATEWRQQPHSESTFLAPEIVFLGRSNSGKSSLLNALLNDPELCRVGPKPGKTVVMHAWSLCPIPPKSTAAKKRFQGDLDAKLTVLDMPGYGYGSHNEWGKDIVKYLTRRRQLRRAFVLVNPAHGLKESDLQTLTLLRENGIAHQLIACKCDAAKPTELAGQLMGIGKSVEDHFRQRQERVALITINDVLAVGNLGDGKSNSRVKTRSMAGVDHVRWAIIRAAGLEEYAMAFVGAVQTTTPHVEVLPKLLEATAQPAKPNMNLPSSPLPEARGGSVNNEEPTVTTSTSMRQDQVSTPPRQEVNPIGVGMDDLISMLGPAAKPKSSTTPSSHGKGSSSSQSPPRAPSRREQLRNRRVAANV